MKNMTIESMNELVNELEIIRNSSDDIKEDYIRNHKELFDGFQDLDINTLMNTYVNEKYDIDYLLDELQIELENEIEFAA